MRSYQDWYLRYALQSLPGVAEVAPVGGFVREYQVQIDPIRLQAYKIPVNAVADAISKSNNDVGGRLVEFSGREYMVRGRGYLRSLDDIGNIVLLNNAGSGTAGSRARRGHNQLRTGRCAAASPISMAAAKPSAAWSSCAWAKTPRR